MGSGVHQIDRRCTERIHMDNTGNIGSFRSVYMAYGAFKVENTGNQTGSQMKTEDAKVPSFLTALGIATGKTADLNASEENTAVMKNVLDGDVSKPPSSFEDSDDLKTVLDGDVSRPRMKPENSYGDGAFLSYTRIITAKLPDDIASNMKTGADGSAFDYSGDGQDLKITIKVSGDSRIYTASGTDKEGNAFSKEIDPYSVDPTDTDYAGFATLCAYIRDTEGMADNAMQAVRDAAPSDITENGNYVLKVGYVSMNTGNLSGAKKLFEQMQTFFEKLMNISADNNVNGLSEQNVTTVRSDDNDGSADGLVKVSTSASKGSYNRIVEELQEMIQLMIQSMLNEIIGVDDIGDTTAKSEEKAENTTESTPDSDAVKDSLNLENATEL